MDENSTVQNHLYFDAAINQFPIYLYSNNTMLGDLHFQNTTCRIHPNKLNIKFVSLVYKHLPELNKHDKMLNSFELLRICLISRFDTKQEFKADRQNTCCLLRSGEPFLQSE